MNLSKVIYQGLPGAYSDIAIKKYFGNKVEPCGKNSFAEIFKAVKSCKCNFGMVPIENSITGSIYENYDLLAKYHLYIIGELYLKISHNLLVVPLKNKSKAERLKMIKTVSAHPQGILQCQKFLTKHSWLKSIYAIDNAGSAKELAETNDLTSAAIASIEAAKIYHLQILIKGIETNSQNYTRFVVISKKMIKEKINKVSLILSLTHKPGSLFNALKVFADRKINLTKLESRPILGKPWQYLFYLDFEIESLKEYQQAIKELKKHCLYLKTLGYYKKGKTVKS